MIIPTPLENLRETSVFLTFSGGIEMEMPFLCPYYLPYNQHTNLVKVQLILYKCMPVGLPFSPAELCKTLNVIFFNLLLSVLMKYFSSTFARVSCSRAKLLFSLSPSKCMMQLNFSMLSNLARTEKEMIKNPAGNYLFKVSNGNTRKIWELQLNFTIKTPYDVVLGSILLTLNRFYSFV